MATIKDKDGKVVELTNSITENLKILKKAGIKIPKRKKGKGEKAFLKAFKTK